MPHRTKLKRKKARAVWAEGEVVAARKRRKKKAVRLAKLEEKQKSA